jgi:NTP pyrophosphatase (non-canonical NTP hydrolase)
MGFRCGASWLEWLSRKEIKPMASAQPDPLSKLLQDCPLLERVQSGFDDYQRACFVSRAPEFFALELAGETGELANLEKKLWKGTTHLKSGEPIAGFPVEDEAADVLIALMNYCNARGIDLASAVARKLAVIEERRRASIRQG